MGFLDRFLKKSAPPPAATTHLPENLLPKLWSRAAFDLEGLGNRVHGRTPWVRECVPFGEGLLLGMARISPGQLIEFRPTEEGSGVTFEQALAHAVQNLARISTEPFAVQQPGVYLAPWDDASASARILLVDKIRALTVRGRHVVFLPSRDCMIVTGSEDQAGLEEAGNLAFAEFESHDRPLACIPLILDDAGAWSAWRSAPDHPCHGFLRLLRTNDWMTYYESQAELLRKERPDVHVPSLFVDDASGEVASQWLDGRTNLLPAVGLVQFHSNDGPAALVADAFRAEGIEATASFVQRASFERVLRVVPHRLRATEHYPPRYETVGFPTAEELAALAGS